MVVIVPFWGWVLLLIVWIWPLAVSVCLTTGAYEKYPNLEMFGWMLLGLWGFYFMFLGAIVQRKEIPEWWIWLSEQTIISML